MKIRRLLLPPFALGLAALLLAPPPPSEGFSTLGTSLAPARRHFRILDNFADASANDNATPDPLFPGQVGAELALWKGATEWASEPWAGTGGGDPTQNLGDGGGNFDFDYAGIAAAPGDKTTSVLGSCSGGTLAYVQLSFGGSWTMRFCDNWTWSDGPGFAPGGQFDIQGVGCHEYGHALGLGHSNVSNATMWPSTSSGNPQRSIASDDIAGLQSIYGIKSPNKPRIDAVSYVQATETVTITGVNFDAVDNEVWFTPAGTTGNGDPRIIVSGVTSSGGVITLSRPPLSGPGVVMVKIPGLNHLHGSNAFPIDLVGPGPQPLSISGVSPSTVDRLIPGTDETVTLIGTGFAAGSTDVLLDGVPLATSFTVVSASTITFDMPDAGLGGHLVEVEKGAESASIPITVAANAAPTLQAGSGDDGDLVPAGGFPVVLAGPPGDLHLLVLSTSSLPSNLPGKIHLDLGASFSQTVNAGLFVIGAGGVATDTVSTGVGGFDLYLQSLRIPIPFAFPFTESNLQHVFVQ